MPKQAEEELWYSVKCIFRHDDVDAQSNNVAYEERVVILKASSLDGAIALGEGEAEAYAGENGTSHYVGFISAFHLFASEVTDKTEVYSLMRKSEMDTDAFLDRYYDDGTECTQKWQADSNLGL